MKTNTGAVVSIFEGSTAYALKNGGKISRTALSQSLRGLKYMRRAGALGLGIGLFILVM